MQPPDFINDIARSLGFLSRLPVPGRFFTGDDGRMERTPAGFAVAGLIVAALPALTLFVAGQGQAPLLAAVLATGLLVAMTGGLHEDGLADTVDGLGGGRNRERALSIMKDSRIGSYGALALALSLLVRVSALLAILAHGSPASAALAMMGSAALSRAAMVWHWRALPAAKPDGVAASVGQPAALALNLALASGTIAFLLLVLPNVSLLRAVTAVLAALAVIFVFNLHIRSRLNGHTGDTIGATQQISDMVILSALALTA